MNRIYNFSAGPAILPVSVLEEASRAVLEINNTGMSLLEVSHRGKVYDPIHAGAMENVLKTLNLSADDFSVIFLGGGASLQFAMLPMNFLSTGQTADYVDSGEWSAKALKEAKRFGTVNVAGSTASDNYTHLPKDLNFTDNARYAHLTTNNTIYGTQWQQLPRASAPLVADMSSDIFAVNRDFSKFDLFYAGAQKNAGPAGVTIVVVKKSFLETASTDVPAMLSYRTQADKDSLYNTPPVFPIYVMNLVCQWIQGEGGITEIEKRNREKARLIYDALDAYPDFYQPTVTDKADRSLMNITFVLKNDALGTDFLAEAKRRQMDGLKGHRNVGGFRASIYNAFPVAGCQALADLLHDFAKQHG